MMKNNVFLEGEIDPLYGYEDNPCEFSNVTYEEYDTGYYECECELTCEECCDETKCPLKAKYIVKEID